jgi:hypothetical protein
VHTIAFIIKSIICSLLISSTSTFHCYPHRADRGTRHGHSHKNPRIAIHAPFEIQTESPSFFTFKIDLPSRTVFEMRQRLQQQLQIRNWPAWLIEVIDGAFAKRYPF